MKRHEVKIFGNQPVRTVWDDKAEEWLLSIIDVVAVLTDSDNPRKYWSVLKTRLKKEGNETATNCSQLKLQAEDGKMRLTDVATPEQMFRIIQSMPSPKAEPFKVWMAKVAAERIDQLQDPVLSIQQALADYRRLGYTEQWITRRLKSIDVRKDLTDEWKESSASSPRRNTPSSRTSFRRSMHPMPVPWTSKSRACCRRNKMRNMTQFHDFREVPG